MEPFKNFVLLILNEAYFLYLTKTVQQLHLFLVDEKLHFRNQTFKKTQVITLGNLKLRLRTNTYHAVQVASEYSSFS